MGAGDAGTAGAPRRRHASPYPSANEAAPAATVSSERAPETEVTAPVEPEAPASPEAALRRRLEMLDRLYEAGSITGTELGEARRRALAEATGAPVHAGAGAAAAFQPPPPASPAAAPSPVTAPVGKGPPLDTPRPDRRRIAGLPAVLALVIAALVLAGAAVVLVTLAGDDDEPEVRATGPVIDPQQAYARSIRRPLQQLTASSVEMGKTLGRTSEPQDVRRVNRVAERQIDVIEAARRRLAGIPVAAGDRRAHGALLRAAANQRRYLVLLSRATSGPPREAQLRAVNRARAAGGVALGGYRTFFTLAPAAPDAITATDLADTSGLRAAIQQGLLDAEEAAAPDPVPVTPAPAPAPPAVPRTYTGPSFQSPTGNLRCQLNGSSLFCSSSNDGFGVALPDFGTSFTTSGSIAAGGVSVPYGSSWSGGIFRCDSAFNGITCRNGSGNGFFLNRDTFNPF